MRFLSRYFSKIRGKNSRAKNGAIKVTLSNIFGQGSFVLVTPLLATLYSPEEFGLFGTFVALYIIAAHFSTLKYENAVAIAKSDEHAAASAWLSLGLVAVVNLVFYFIVFLCSKYNIFLSTSSMLATTYNEIEIAALLAGVGLTLNVWLLRQRRYTTIAITRIIYCFAIIFAQILLGWYWNFSEGLIAGQIMGLAVMVIFQVTCVLTGDRTSLQFPSFETVKYVASRFSNFPKFSVWATLVGQFSAQAPVIIFAATGNLQSAGFYFMALRLLQAPLGMISQSISQVVLAEAPDMYAKGSLDRLVVRIFSVCLRLGLLPMAVVCFLIVDIFSVFGMQEWHQTAIFIWIIAPWVFLVFILGPISVITTIIEKQKEWLIFQVTMFCFRVAGLVVGILYFNVTIAVIIYTLVGFVSWLLFFFWIMRELSIEPRALLGKFLKTGVITVLCLITLYVIQTALQYFAVSAVNNTMVLVICASIFILGYFYQFVSTPLRHKS